MKLMKIYKSIYSYLKKDRCNIHLSKGDTLKRPNNFKCKKFSLYASGGGNTISLGTNFNSKDFELTVKGINNEVIIGDNFINNGQCKILVVGSNNKIVIGDNVQIVTQLVIYNHDNSKDCKINIGNKTSFYKTEISTYDNDSSIEIGEDCMFDFDTIIYNTDGHSIFQNGNLINKADKLVIGDHVWCGWGCAILKNSYIPSGCIVGKSAVVAKKFNRENCAIAGNPAKIIKENICWNRKSINEIIQENYNLGDVNE